MPPSVHPCLCGYVCARYPQMRYHRRKCEVWKNRPDPKELTKQRRATHRRTERPEPVKCSICNARRGRHKSTCQFSVEERRRQALLERHGIDPVFWEAFLKALTDCYEAEG